MHIVLCLNDYPIGIYASMEDASHAKDEWEEKHPRFPGQQQRYFHYHQFEIGAQARL